MTFRDHLGAVLDRWRLVLGLTVAGLLVGVLVALAQPSSWSSSTLVAIGPRTTATSTPSSTTMALQDPSIRSTLAQIAMSPATVTAATAAAQAGGSDPKVAAIVVNDSNIVEIRGAASDGAAAERLSRSATSATIASFERVYPLFQVLTVSPASSAKQQKASVLTSAVLGGIVGLFLGYLVALGSAAARRSAKAEPDGGTAEVESGAGPSADDAPVASAATAAAPASDERDAPAKPAAAAPAADEAPAKGSSAKAGSGKSARG